MTEPARVTRGRKTVNGSIPQGENVTQNVTSAESGVNLLPETDEWEQERRVDAAIGEVRGMLGEFDAEPEIQVWRKLPTGKREFCDSYPVSNFEDQTSLLKRIRGEWGSGRYSIYLHAAGSVRLNRDVLVAADPSGTTRKPAGLGDDVVQRLEQGQAALAAQIAQSMQVLAAALERPKVSAEDNMMATLTMMGKMREVFAPAPAPSVIDQLGQLNGIFDMAKKVRETVDPQPAPEDPFSALAPKAMDLIGGFLANQQAAAAVQLPAAVVPASLAATRNAVAGNPAGAPVQEGEISAMGSGQTDEQREIKLAIEQVNVMARFGTPPEQAAELIWEKAPGDLVTLLADPTWFDQLSRVVPSMVPHKEWYLKTAAEVLRIETEESKIDAAEGTAGQTAPPVA